MQRKSSVKKADVHEVGRKTENAENILQFPDELNFLTREKLIPQQRGKAADYYLTGGF